MVAHPDEPPPVWPDPEGKGPGGMNSPAFQVRTQAVARDKRLYELLVLVDAIRGGRARERDITVKEEPVGQGLRDEKDAPRKHRAYKYRRQPPRPFA